MRRVIVCSCLGLAAVSSLTGCGLFGNSRAEPVRTAAISRKKAMPPMAQLEGSDPASHVKVSVPKAGMESAPVVSVERPAMRPLEATSRLPVVEPTVKTEAAPVAKLDPLAEERAIIQRELAGRSGKDAATIADEPTAPAKPIVVEPAPIVRPTPATKPIVVEPMPMVPEIIIATPTEVVRKQEKPLIVSETMPPGKEKTVALKTIEIQYGPGENYKSITGKVERFGRTWRLRYGDASQEDTYGGVVILEGTPELSKLREGQHVRVTGVVMPAETRTGSAIYQVKTIEILD